MSRGKRLARRADTRNAICAVYSGRDALQREGAVPPGVFVVLRCVRSLEVKFFVGDIISSQSWVEQVSWSLFSGRIPIARRLYGLRKKLCSRSLTKSAVLVEISHSFLAAPRHPDRLADLVDWAVRRVLLQDPCFLVVYGVFGADSFHRFGFAHHTFFGHDRP